MRFRKRPKIVEAVPVANIIAGDRHPYWLIRAVKAGKVHIHPNTVQTVIGRNARTAFSDDFLAHDIVQDMVFIVSKKTLELDYDRLEDEVVS